MEQVAINPMLVTRFWKYVDRRSPDECWEWTGATLSGRINNYGKLSTQNGLILAHRLSWIINKSPIPDGLCILHHCDNPSCVNPNHLFLGTMKDNARDMIEKGRGNWTNASRGENHYRAKLTREQVIEIRSLLSKGNKKQTEIAEMYGIGRRAVSKIAHRTNWKDI